MNDIYPNRIFLHVYSKNSRYKLNYCCGDDCLFYIDNLTPKQLSFMHAILIQQRIMRLIHKKGYRIKRNHTYASLTEEIDRNAHLACKLGAVNESHFCNPDYHFSISNMIE